MTRNTRRRSNVAGRPAAGKIRSSRRILSSTEAASAEFDVEDVKDMLDWVAEETGAEIANVEITDGGIVAEINGEASELILAEEGEAAENEAPIESSRRRLMRRR
jgi:hypothetical protein